jgi:hypothetical protein
VSLADEANQKRHPQELTMFSVRPFSFALKTLAPLALVVAGCAANTSAEPANSTSDDLAKRQSVLASTFTVTGATDETLFNSFTLKADQTFSGQGGCRQDKAPHCFAVTSITGTWKTTTSGPQLGAPGGVPQLEFTDSLGQVTTYFYSLSSDQLTLQQAFGGDKTLFDRDISKLPKLRSDAVCADKYNNSLGQCPEDLPCEYDGPDSNTQRCLPPI